MRETLTAIALLPSAAKAELHAHLKEGGELLAELSAKHFALEAAARAVIAAGRPHTYENNLQVPAMPCRCPQCAAWDGLASLLKDTP